MGFLSGCTTLIFYLGAFLTGSPLEQQQLDFQQPLQGESHALAPLYNKPPDFEAPPGPYHGQFNCSYPAMVGWSDCSTPGNRGCWLRAPNGTEFNISTDYEVKAPIGIQRNVSSLTFGISISNRLRIVHTDCEQPNHSC